jgi:hypothetical protein
MAQGLRTCPATVDPAEVPGLSKHAWQSYRVSVAGCGPNAARMVSAPGPSTAPRIHPMGPDGTGLRKGTVAQLWRAAPKEKAGSRAADLFAVQPVHDKQGFLRLILKSATWRQGELQTEFQQPFENLRRSNQLSNTKHKENGAPNAEIDTWLRGSDSK